jgi:hypothetical protein
MNKFLVPLGVLALCIPAAALITFKLMQWLIRKQSGKPFRPIYCRRECVLDDIDMKYHTALEPLLQEAGLKLLPNANMEQIARGNDSLSESERLDAFLDLKGRSVQFLLVGAHKLNPLAVVHIGGDGSPGRPEVLDGIKSVSALFQSIGVPEIVVYDRDMIDPAHVAQRIQDIVRGGKTGIINV